MRIITPSRLRSFASRHADAAESLQRWEQLVSAADWSDVEHLRAVFASADPVRVASGRTVYVFNIKGNRFRLIVAIHFNTRRVFIRDFLTHAQYSKDAWKQRH